MTSSKSTSEVPAFPLVYWIPLAFIVLIGTLAVFETTQLDIVLQDHFYDFTAKRWMFEDGDSLPKMLFYNGPKVLFGVMAAGLIVALIAGWKWERKRIVAVFLCCASLPIVIGVLKNATDVYFPSQVKRYGGKKPYVRLFEPYPEAFLAARSGTGHGFPAAHASGGFALMGLGYLAASRRSRRITIAVGFVLGWTLGMYQTAHGMHYVSHTLVTCGIAFLLIPLPGKVLRL